MLEKQIEKKVCDYAKSQGCAVYKFTSPARAAVPDRLFITPDGVVFFIEFKAAGKKPTPAQLREIKNIKDHNVLAFVIDDVEAGVSHINMMLARD